MLRQIPRFKKPRSVDGMMDELHGIIAYFEDLRRSGNPELGPHIVKLKDFAGRISAMADEKEGSESEPKG